MTIQAALSDVVKQCAIASVEVIKVTGTATETVVQTFDADKTLFIEGNLTEVIPEFEGEFGITNLKMLSGLLGFTNYQTDTADFKVRSRDVNGAKALDQFEFKGSGSKSVFKLMDVQHVPQQAKIASIPWNITLTEVSKSKITEFQQFAGLYAEIDKQFGVSVEDGNLVVTFGAQASSTHSGSMVFAEGISGTLTGTLTFPVDKFLMLMKIAQNAQSSKLMFTSKGLLGVEAVTNHGVYNYFLRQSVRG
jgi:hypothetical protein